jgi:uracil-DNA glycosylase
MPDRLPEALRTKITQRLTYYQDIGIHLFYKDRPAQSANAANASCTGAALLYPEPRRVRPSLPGLTPHQESVSPSSSESSVAASPETPFPIPEPQEETLPKPSPKSPTKPIIPQSPSVTATSTVKSTVLPSVSPAPPTQKITILPPSPKVSLFDAVSKIPDDSLLKIREDLGECTRCKLHATRNKIVFGDGNPKAQLVFVGEGPGRDEDAQGLPFVGRAGKLLTQMIEAMGLQRQDVYICNVVKCRPPENRLPEPDEIKTCSPFLLRQLDTIAPKVIVCLGACSAQTLLETNRGISHFRGQWLEFRGRKLMATYHPAYLLRNPAAKADVWKDLQKVMAELGLEVKKSKSASASERPS